MNIIKTNADLRQDLLKQVAKGMIAIMIAVGIGLFAANFIGNQAERLAEHREDIGEIAAGFDALGEAERKLAASEDVFSAIDEALIPIAELQEFLTVTQRVADEAGLVQEDLAFGNVSQDHSGEIAIATVPLTITLRGNVGDLADYIERFEAMPYFASINSFSLNAPTNGWGNSGSNILLNGRLHVLSR